MKPLMEVRNLTKTFQDKKGNILTAVDHVDFSLYPHEILGIVGESGSGKSSIAKMLTRLLDCSEGQIFFSGQEITHWKGKNLREIYQKIQMVFQMPVHSFDPRQTLGMGIGESLRNIGMHKKEIKKRVEMLLEQCGLSVEYADRYPHQVSGGQCQRAAIARALAIRPQILILDEATSALDVTVQKQVIELLMDLKKEYGMSYLFICHDLALVQHICDRILVMSHGKIIEEGAANEVIMHPKHVDTKRLVSAIL